MSKDMHVILIDGNSIYRRFHGAFKQFGAEDSEERAFKAMDATQSKVYGMYGLLGGTHSCVFFDGNEETWRHVIHPTYKYDKQTMQPKVKSQAMIESIFLCQSNIENAGIKTFRKENLEADDPIATVANILLNKKNIQVTIVSCDKDFCQLVQDNVRMYHPFDKKYILEKDVKEKYGLSREQFTEMLALAGDDSDNVPGIPGIKDKTAKKLLDEYGNIEHMILCRHLMEGKRGENFSQHHTALEEYKKLVNLRDMKVDLDFGLSDMRIPEKFRQKKMNEKKINNNYEM